SPIGQDSGAAYVFFGQDPGQASYDLASLDGGAPSHPASGFKISGGATYDYTGFAVSPAGDFNGDGQQDVAIGAPLSVTDGMRGASYVLFGEPSGLSSNIDLSGLNGTNGFKIVSASSGSDAGYSVASAGDVNHDGYSDIIIGDDGLNQAYV